MRVIYFYIITTIFTFLITSCAGHEHKLNHTNYSDMVTGKITHEDPTKPDQLILEIGGKRYAGNLKITKNVNWKNIREAYGSDSNHLNRISSGIDTDHLITIAQTEINSPDGETMQCKLVWTKSKKPVGDCINSKGDNLALQFE